MSEAAFDLGGVFAALTARAPGGGRAVMFIDVGMGDGAMRAAYAAAQAASQKPVFAVDLDLRRNALAQAFAKDSALGAKVDGSLGGVGFCRALGRDGRVVEGSDGRFCYHRVGKSGTFVGVYEGRGLPLGAQLEISFSGEYWKAARAAGGTIVTLAPPLRTSTVGLRVAAHMDGVVLVVDGAAGAAPAAQAAKAALTKAGAHVLGLIYADASAPIVALDRWMRQAG